MSYGPKSIDDWTQDIHQWAKDKGWWNEGNRNFGELLMLVTTEISEAFEEWRKHYPVTRVYYENADTGKPDLLRGVNITEFEAERRKLKPEGIPTELADAVIRIMDLCGYYGIDLEREIRHKMRYNEKREYRHGGKRA